MADRPAQNNTSSDEIDLGQLFQMIGKGFHKIWIAFLRLFLFLKKYALILVGLIILGLAAGYGLNQIIDKKLKIEVIVKPNLESKNYLYNVVDEIENNLRSGDTVFFKTIGADVSNLTEFKISIEPLDDQKKVETDFEYLELLEKFQSNEEFSEVIKSEFLNKSTLSHKITFLFKDSSKGKVFAGKIMDYINSNDYFNELTIISNQNAFERIKKNEIFIEQIDGLISAYSKNMIDKAEQKTDGQIVLNSEERMDVTGLFALKNRLIQDIEEKRLELKEQKEPVNVVNFGKPQQVKKAFFGKSIVVIPLILTILFFGILMLIEINKRAISLKQ